jgi:hypothetical protein
MRSCGDKENSDLEGGKIVAWCGQTNERLTVGDTIRETMELWYVRMASDQAHANGGVMSGMGISK